MKAKRKKVVIREGGHMKGPVLTHMREVAYGKKSVMRVENIIDRSERMRDDEGMLAAAEQKRLRKMKRNLRDA